MKIPTLISVSVWACVEFLLFLMFLTYKLCGETYCCTRKPTGPQEKAELEGVFEGASVFVQPIQPAR